MIFKSRIFLNSLPVHWTDSYWEIHLLPRIKRIKSTKPQRNQDSTVQQKLFRISQWVFFHQVEVNARLQVRASTMAVPASHWPWQRVQVTRELLEDTHTGECGLWAVGCGLRLGTNETLWNLECSAGGIRFSCSLSIPFVFPSYCS